MQIGVISEISSDSILGNYIVMEDSKAYKSKYAGWQRCNVSIGQEVKKGQEIGFVAEPTKYSVALGEHMDFSMAKDGIKVDPKSNVAE